MKTRNLLPTILLTIAWFGDADLGRGVAAEGPLASFCSPVKVKLVVDGKERAVAEAVVSRQLITKVHAAENLSYAFAGECLFLELAYRGEPIGSVAGYTLADANSKDIVGWSASENLFTGVATLEDTHYIIRSIEGGSETHYIGFSLQQFPLLAVRYAREIRVVTTSRRAKHALLEKATSEPTAQNLNEAAWLLATSPDPAVRDGTRALALARRACEESKWQDPASIDTLSAAYAETGDFAEAVRTQERALRLGNLSAQERPAYENRLLLYRDKKPFREE